MTREGSNFIREIAEAYQALEVLPQRDHQIKELEAQRLADGERIARLEKRLMDRSIEMETLQARIRSLEVERDDAGFRELVAQEQATAAINALRSTFSNVGEALKALQPEPKAEPVPEPALVAQSKSEWSGSPDPARPDTHWIDDNTGQSIAAEPEASHPTGTGEPISPTQSVGGESATDPIASSMVGDIHQPQGVLTSTATPSEDVVTAEPPSNGKYHGLNYYDLPSYIPFNEWLAEGGTHDDYYSRRTA